MSNFSQIVFDDTNARGGTPLAKGRVLLDTADGGRLYTGDGATIGGVPHVTRYPASPASVVQSNYDNHYADWRLRFFDDTNNRLYPTRGLGPTNAGCPDTTLPDSSGNKLSPWQWCQGINALYARWKATGTAKSLSRITGAWTYFKTQFTVSQMTSTVYGSNPTTGLSDDSCWFANALRMIHAATGDATALQVLLEYIPATLRMYQDTRTATNPITSYGVSSPGGIALQRNALGIKYDYNAGDVSASYEIGLAYAAFYVSQLPTAGTLTAAYKAGLLQYAKDTWTWAQTYLKYAGSATAVAGIYVNALNIAPANSPGTQNHTDIYPTTQRGITAFTGAGTLAMGVLSDALYTLTGAAAYLAEFQSVATAYPTQGIVNGAYVGGFGRTWMGMPCLCSSEDPWVGGFWHAEFTSRLVARYPAATNYSAYKLAILGASKMIAAQSASGIISPNWIPSELGPDAGTFTWEQSSMYGAYSGNGGGGQGSGRQIMAASSSINILASAIMLQPVELALGSGMSAGGIEIMTGAVIAALIGIQNELTNPIKAIGNYGARANNFNSSYDEFYSETINRRINSGGQEHFGTLTQHGSISADGSLYASTGNVVAQNLASSGATYLGNLFSGYGVNLGRAGAYVFADSGGTYIGYGNVNLITATPTATYLNGLTNYVLNDFCPTNDNSISLGKTTKRYINVFATNATINTSDATKKTWRGPLSGAELAAGKRILDEIGVYQWNDKVATEGDKARLHFGVRAQAVWAIMADEGLIPDNSLTDCPYAFLTYEKWDASPSIPAVEAVPEVSHFDEQGRLVIDTPGVPGNPGQNAMPAGELYGVRGGELDAFLSAVNHQRLKTLEAANAK